MLYHVSARQVGSPFINFLIVIGIIGGVLWLLSRYGHRWVPPRIFPYADDNPQRHYRNLMLTFDRGIRFEHIGDYQSAVGLFLIVVQVRPKWAEAHYHLGRAYIRLGQHEQARRQWEDLKALDLDWAAKLYEELRIDP